MKASDSDSGANAEIVYSVSNDHFAVDNNGVISNNKRLDADSNNAYYEFQVWYGGPERLGCVTCFFVITH